MTNRIELAAYTTTALLVLTVFATHQMVGSGRDLRTVADPVEPSQQRGETSERGNPSGKQPS